MANQSMMLSQEQRMQMTLAPQLRQSLEMLQLPILELRTMIQQEIEKNPTIEELPETAQSIDATADPEEQKKNSEADPERRTQLDFREDFKKLSALDDEWRSYFFQEDQRNPYSPDADEKRKFLLDSIPQKQSLQEHLLDQLKLSGLPDEDRQIGELIIGSINDDGYLNATLDEMATTADVDAARLQDVLSVIQDFDPTGVAARDLRECLLIQLDRLGMTESPAYAIVRDHLQDLGSRKHAEIARALQMTPDDVRKAADLIATLDPKPGRGFSAESPAYVFPEITVQKIEGEYTVILNDENLPHVRISENYRKLMEDKNTPADVREYVMQKIKSGVFMIKSIQQRQQTLFKIAGEIVRTQKDFLDHGVTHFKPLTMVQVASVVGVHETTVSRAVSGKYIQTPSGVFEMKYFFASGLATQSGGAVSNKAVQDMIAKLVAAEDPGSPLSDQDIQNKLSEQGIRIARRTVAKYRILMHIQPSHLRKAF